MLTKNDGRLVWLGVEAQLCFTEKEIIADDELWQQVESAVHTLNPISVEIEQLGVHQFRVVSITQFNGVEGTYCLVELRMVEGT